MKTINRSVPLFLGSIIVLAILVLTIIIGITTFIQPQARFAPTSADWIWVAIAVILPIILALISKIQGGQFLIIFVIIEGCVLFSLPIFFSPARGGILVGLWIMLTAFGLGNWLMFWFKLKVQNSFLQAGLATLCGLACWMVISLLLGILGLYYPWIAFLLTLAASVLTIFWIIRHQQIRAANALKNILKKSREYRLGALVLSILLLCAFASYLWALAPSVRFDDASYHVAVPMRYIDQHAIVEIPETIQTYWAHYAEMLYTFGLLILPSSGLPGILNFFIGVLCLCFTFELGRKIGGARTGWIAYIDLFSCSFFNGILLILIQWKETQQTKWLLFAGVMGGILTGIKLINFILLVPVALYILVMAYRKNRVSKNFWIQLISFALPVILFFSPWAIRETIWTGNPIFPNYNDFFRSPKWFTSELFTIDLPRENFLGSLILLPLRLVTNSTAYYHESDGGALAGLPLLFLPWLYGWSSLLLVDQRRSAWRLLACVMLTFALFRLSAPNARYMIPLMPTMAVLAALNFDALWQFIKPQRHRATATTMALLMTCCYIGASQMSLLDRFWVLPERVPYKYALGLESEPDFIRRLMPVYDAFQFLNQIGDGRHKILSVGNDLRLYTFSEIYGISSKTSYKILQNSNVISFISELQSAGFEYLLIYPPAQIGEPKLYRVPVLDSAFFQKYTHLIYVKQDVYIYELSPEQTLPQSMNLLENPGFEQANTDWTLVNQPEWIINSRLSHSGEMALKITGPSVSAAYQIIPVSASDFYILGYWSNPQQPDQILQLFVEWLDENQSLISSSSRWDTLEPGWQWSELVVMAPENAAYARFIVSTATDGETIVDDLCFALGAHCP
jgi:hypothetical protein